MTALELLMWLMNGAGLVVAVVALASLWRRPRPPEQ